MLDNIYLVKVVMVSDTLGANQSVTAAADRGWQRYVGLESIHERHMQQLFYRFAIAHASSLEG